MIKMVMMRARLNIKNILEGDKLILDIKINKKTKKAAIFHSDIVANQS
jgi:hypothetical protein